MPPVIGTTTAIYAWRSSEKCKPVATHDVALVQATASRLIVPGTTCGGPTTPLVMGMRMPSKSISPNAKHEVGLAQVRPDRLACGMTCVGPGIPSVMTVTVPGPKPVTMHTLGLGQTTFCRRTDAGISVKGSARSTRGTSDTKSSSVPTASPAVGSVPWKLSVADEPRRGDTRTLEMPPFQGYRCLLGRLYPGLAPPGYSNGLPFGASSKAFRIAGTSLTPRAPAEPESPDRGTR